MAENSDFSGRLNHDTRGMIRFSLSLFSSIMRKTTKHAKTRMTKLPSAKGWAACLVGLFAVAHPPSPVMAQSESVTAANGFVWSAQKATIDFATPDGKRQFGALLQDAHEKTILYLDWTLLNAAQTRWGQTVGSDGEETATDDTTCGHIERRASGPDGVVISGRPDPENNHLLFKMALDLARGAPFARVRCEYANGRIALRLRGFFYVTNIGTATANNLEFSPVSIPADRVPAAFLQYLR
ncbi:hypothetical protein [Pelagerythrobacter rhizovicinus]|uniref:Uncharacterized protein n=1 Tax=Pelagerythrobacter rhizovicinus TaxID=2268576 RepID=A0A4Q2KSM0_9SPHN|nr:hypothetical protein [Pelagerythrobacter rhizovicinus]RXZ66341.1 hypothetical protein ETX26_06505 [Pelagerythrobacter rhizovicinus]